MKQVTSKDLAAHLGVSQATVSMALRNSPEIALKTRERVQEAARVMNYTPNRVAQSMRGRRSNNIGILVPEINSFFADIVNGAEQEAKLGTSQCFVCQTHNRIEKAEEEVEALLANLVGGLIIQPINSVVSRKLILSLQKRSVNLVLICEGTQGVRVPIVQSDNRLIGRLATEHLLALGHRKVACIRRPADCLEDRDRFQGYLDALKDAGISFSEDLIVDLASESKEADKAVEELIARGKTFTAFVSPIDILALQAMRVFRKAGIRVPEDVSVIGCGNLDSGFWHGPALTTIDQFPVEIGRAAVRLLTDNQTSGSESRRVARVITNSRIIVRESTARYVPLRKR